MSLPTRRFVAVLAVVGLFGSSAAIAQMSGESSNASSDERARLSVAAAPLEPGGTIRFNTDGVTRAGWRCAGRSAPVGDGVSFAAAPPAVVSNMPVVGETGRPVQVVRQPAASPTVWDEAVEEDRPERIEQPSPMLYAPIPGLFHGAIPLGFVDYDGRSLRRTFNASEYMGRRETFHKGALDIYNERMGNPTRRDDVPDPYTGLAVPDYLPERAYDSGYRSGQYQAELWLARHRNLLQTARTSLDRGTQFFFAGNYNEALSAFRLAGASDHGDAGARLLTAHACFALGRYDDAVRYLRRAFELQPKIAFLNYDLRHEYGVAGDFQQHLERLEAEAQANPKAVAPWVLLGYVYRYTGAREDAAITLANAEKLDPADPLVARLLDRNPDPAK